MASFPFARLNLRWNPFGEPDEDDRQDLFSGGLEDWPSFLGAKITLGEGTTPDGDDARALQVLGPSGCGKTTALQALRELFPDSVWLAWCPVRGWPELPASQGRVLFVDDAHMASPSLLGGFLRFQRLAVATQRDLTVSFRQAGIETRTVRLADELGLPRLERMVERRLEWARRGPGPLPAVEEGTLSSLLALHGPDLKAIQSDLYDRYQKLADET